MPELHLTIEPRTTKSLLQKRRIGHQAHVAAIGSGARRVCAKKLHRNPTVQVVPVVGEFGGGLGSLSCSPGKVPWFYLLNEANALPGVQAARMSRPTALRTTGRLQPTPGSSGPGGGLGLSCPARPSSLDDSPQLTFESINGQFNPSTPFDILGRSPPSKLCERG